jgi:heme-degrading monooxygenase HmoA
MPIISPDSGYLTVLNLFLADEPEKQNLLLGAMRQIVDNAGYDGWVSSTVHAGQEKIGTANFIQWKAQENLEARYASDEFRHQIPLFNELTTWIQLLQTTVVYTQRHPSQGEHTEIGPHRDDYTVIEIFGVDPENLDELVDVAGKGFDFLLDVPGYRSHSVLRGKAMRGKFAQPVLGSFAVRYSQWDDKESYDAFRLQAEAEQSAERRSSQAQLDSLTTSLEWNTYRVFHSRSADQPTALSA